MTSASEYRPPRNTHVPCGDRFCDATGEQAPPCEVCGEVVVEAAGDEGLLEPALPPGAYSEPPRASIGTGMTTTSCRVSAGDEGLLEPALPPRAHSEPPRATIGTGMTTTSCRDVPGPSPLSAEVVTTSVHARDSGSVSCITTGASSSSEASSYGKATALVAGMDLVSLALAVIFPAEKCNGKGWPAAVFAENSARQRRQQIKAALRATDAERPPVLNGHAPAPPPPLPSPTKIDEVQIAL